MNSLAKIYGAPLFVLVFAATIIVSSISGTDDPYVPASHLKTEYVMMCMTAIAAGVYLLRGFLGHSPTGLRSLAMYILLFLLSLGCAFLSWIGAGFTNAGAQQMIYWCGLISFIAIAGIVGLAGYSEALLLAAALSGLPVAASLLAEQFPLLYSLVPGQIFSPVSEIERMRGIFVNPNNSAFALFTALAGTFALSIFSPGKLAKSMVLILLPLYTYGILLTQSRAALMVTILAAMAFIYLKWRGHRFRWAILGLLGLATLLVSDIAFDMISRSAILESRSFYSGDIDDNLFRLQGIMAAIEKLPQNLIIGQGPATFPDVSGDYIGAWGTSPHNQILATWVEWGLLALVIMYSAHLWVLRRGVRNFLHGDDNRTNILACIYACILVFFQFHGINNLASCALLGLAAGRCLQSRHLVSSKIHKLSCCRS